MALTAALRVVPPSAVAALRRAAEPAARGWFGRPKDTFWELLADAGPDVLRPGLSGFAVITLFLYLGERAAMDLRPFTEHDLAAHLTHHRDRHFFAVFEGGNVKPLADRLAALHLSDDEVRDFRPMSMPELAGQLRDAADALAGALPRIPQDTLGILYVT